MTETQLEICKSAINESVLRNVSVTVDWDGTREELYTALQCVWHDEIEWEREDDMAVFWGWDDDTPEGYTAWKVSAYLPKN